MVADSASSDAVPLPTCSDSSWGPGVAVDQLGLVATPADGIVTSTDGRVNLEFAKTKPAYVLCKLRKNGMKDEDLEKYITERDEGDVVKVSTDLIYILMLYQCSRFPAVLFVWWTWCRQLNKNPLH